MSTRQGEKSLVSIVVTTKNERRVIADCLSSIKRQTYKNIEILVIDNNSKDTTQSIARKFTSLVFAKGPERSAQRNFGARKAHGAYILFLDADMVLASDVVALCVDECRVSGAKAVIIPEKSFGIGFWSACKALERSFYIGIDWMEAARFYEKEAFAQIGFFDEQLTGPEDFDASQRMRDRFGEENVRRISSFIYHNEGEIKILSVLKKKYYYGRKMSLYRYKHTKNSYFEKQSNMLTRYRLFFSNPEKLFKNPLTAVGMFFLKTAEMVSIAVGAIISA